MKEMVKKDNEIDNPIDFQPITNPLLFKFGYNFIFKLV